MILPIFKAIKYTKRTIILASIAGVVVLLGGTSAIAAKANAAPGSTLYPFKRLWEGGKLFLSFSSVSKAQTNVSIAQDRVKAAQTVVSQTPAATNGSQAVDALQQAQQKLESALTQTKQISDPVQKKEVSKSISDAAKETENEIQSETESESTSSTDKQNLQKTSDQVKQIQSQASADD